MKRTAIKSSSLVSAGYDAGKKFLDVEFNSGKVYRYTEVPENMYAQLLKADSAGKYFSANIRNSYDSHEIGDKVLVLKNLSDEQKKEALAHFNSVYECNVLTEHEYRIIYLAWLWSNGFVNKTENGMTTFEESETGVPLTDYEITIEDEVSGGVNLDLMRSYYDLDKLIQLMKWNQQ